MRVLLSQCKTRLISDDADTESDLSSLASFPIPLDLQRWRWVLHTRPETRRNVLLYAGAAVAASTAEQILPDTALSQSESARISNLSRKPNWTLTSGPFKP